MDDIFDNIIDAADNIEEVFDGIGNRVLQDYYALFIAEMAYCNYIEISPEFAAKLYIVILSTDIDDSERYLEKINSYIVGRSIAEIEKEKIDD